MIVQYFDVLISKLNKLLHSHLSYLTDYQARENPVHKVFLPLWVFLLLLLLLLLISMSTWRLGLPIQISTHDYHPRPGSVTAKTAVCARLLGFNSLLGNLRQVIYPHPVVQFPVKYEW